MRRLHQRDAGFTLLELLAVLIIIGVIAALGVQALPEIKRSHNDISAQRQLLDDIARARQLALSTHSEVCMVFVSPQVYNPLAPNGEWVDPFRLGTAGARLYTNLLASQYRGYAILGVNQAGDQPGIHTKRYLSEWRTLPDGIFISPNKFTTLPTYVGDPVMGKFSDAAVPYPLSTNLSHNLPVIVFTGTGGLNTNADAVIPLERGSIFYARDVNGVLVPRAPDVLENRQNNSVSIYSHIRIDWLTGRARVEQAGIQ